MKIILIGVAGSGKTTIGKKLSEKLNIPFLDADDFHPQSNIDKMDGGNALTDKDRWPWLYKVKEEIKKYNKVILACSGLKKSHRKILTFDDTIFIYLKGSFDLIKKRLENRKSHFFSSDLLKSQFDALEEPTNCYVVSIDQNIDSIIKQIMQQLLE